MPWKDKNKYKSEDYREYMRNYQKSWHQRNKAQVLTRVHKRKDQMREFYNQLKAKLECAHCGENHPATLQFHHREPQKKDFILSSAVRRGYGIDRIKREIAKCTVLCANCHAKRHYEWAKQNKKSSNESLAIQLLEVEQILFTNQEEEFLNTIE